PARESPLRVPSRSPRIKSKRVPSRSRNTSIWKRKWVRGHIGMRARRSPSRLRARRPVTVSQRAEVLGWPVAQERLRAETIGMDRSPEPRVARGRTRVPGEEILVAAEHQEVHVA